MKQTEILGTRLVINTSNGSDFKSDLGTTGNAYVYADAVAIDPTTKSIMTGAHKNLSVTSDHDVHWLIRKTSKSSGKPGILSDDDYQAVISIAWMYASHIVAATNARHRKTYYHGVLEALICFSGDKNLQDAFYDPRVSMVAFKDLLANVRMDPSKRVKGTSKVISQDYNRYSMTEFAEDLVTDKALVIMDDSIHKYRWQGRKDSGYGNIKPIIESGHLYPTYRITGIQGNQTNANLSLKFDFKANYDTGTSIKLLEINRNLMVVQNGAPFQDMLALHVSDSLKSKLLRRGLIDAELPAPGDVIIDLARIPVAQRKSQRNRNLYSFIDAVVQYDVAKKELEKLDAQIQWTKPEQTKAQEKAAASKMYWSLNKSQMTTVASGKKRYTVSTKSTGTWPTLSDEEARKLRATLLTKQEESYRTMCTMIFNWLASKKSAREFFGLGKKAQVTGKNVSYTKTLTSDTGLIWTAKFGII
jgi:hypothetical protein